MSSTSIWCDGSAARAYSSRADKAVPQQDLVRPRLYPRCHTIDFPFGGCYQFRPLCIAWHFPRQCGPASQRQWTAPGIMQQFENVHVLLLDTAARFDMLSALQRIHQYHAQVRPSERVCLGCNPKTKNSLAFGVLADLRQGVYNVCLSFCSARQAESDEEESYAICMQPLPDAHVTALASNQENE